jgi:hypothetical protein
MTGTCCSGPIPKFATTRGTFRCELRNLRTTSNSMISSAVLNLKFLNELAASYDRNFKFTALVALNIEAARGQPRSFLTLYKPNLGYMVQRSLEIGRSDLVSTDTCTTWVLCTCVGVDRKPFSRKGAIGRRCCAIVRSPRW